jgi:hypothetical protein
MSVYSCNLAASFDYHTAYSVDHPVTRTRPAHQRNAHNAMVVPPDSLWACCTLNNGTRTSTSAHDNFAGGTNDTGTATTRLKATTVTLALPLYPHGAPSHDTKP